jgi:hypothetical protein
MNPIYIYTTLALGPIIGLIVLSEKNKQHLTKPKLH